jgi:hypothetical protein
MTVWYRRPVFPSSKKTENIARQRKQGGVG